MPNNSRSFPWKTLDDLQLEPGSIVLVRVDFNVPLAEDGSVSNFRRVDEALPTVEWLLGSDYRPVLMSHLGRPGGERADELSLKVLRDPLEDRLGSTVRWADDCVGSPAESMVKHLGNGEVGLLENLRFHPGEKENKPEFATSLASIADAYVNDAFGASHRDHASISGVPDHLEPAVAGRLLEREYRVLTEVRDNPDAPFAILMGGAKLSDKLPVLRKFLSKSDRLLVGGAMAHTFFLAQGYGVGDSLVEEDWVSEAEELLENLGEFECDFVLPEDVLVELPPGDVENCSVDEIPSNAVAKDIGKRTRSIFRDRLEGARTVFWNGPLGVFEEESFEVGTRTMVEALENHDGKVVVGGGDSGAAVEKFSSVDKFHHVSTGGGAALSLMQDKTLPGYAALDEKE